MQGTIEIHGLLMLSNEQNQARTDRERGLADQRERFRSFDYGPFPEGYPLRTDTTFEELHAQMWAIREQEDK